jgi:hypothetical protein
VRLILYLNSCSLCNGPWAVKLACK